jgi:hypothetical protein
VRKTLTLLIALVVAFTVVPGVAQAAWQPKSGGTFNAPRHFGGKDANYRIVHTIEKAIRMSKKGSTVHISTYLLDRSPAVDAMIKACRRGVAVRVILDEDIVNKNSKRLIKALNADNVRLNDSKRGHSVPKAGRCNRPLPGQRTADLDRPLTDAQARASVDAQMEDSVTWGKDGSYVKRCNGSCRGAGGNMHTKMYVFSHTGKARNVVMVSSSNINRGGAELGWNDLYVMKGRPKSHQGYVRIHREMTDDKRAGRGKVELRDGPFTSRFFPMRRASKRNDPTLQDLNKIRCTSALGRTQVHVSMFYWAKHRGEYLATKLLNLANNGCDVNIIYGAPSVAIAERLRNAARANRIDLFDSRWDFNNDGYNEIRTHAKYVLVKGTYAGDRSARVVMTGSQNWVAGSLSRGDESTLNVKLNSAYAQYIKNWNTIRSKSRRLPYNR